MTVRKNITGQRFGLLTAIRPAPSENKRTRWFFQCDCGNARAFNLKNIEALCAVKRLCPASCGCAKTSGMRKHGLSGSPGYVVWNSMMRRCFNASARHFDSYGGRGITVCDRWKHFENFFADMGHPACGMSIDRIDTNGHYCPENCRWATNSEQARNRRSTVLLTFNGKTQCIKDWGRELGISRKTITSRIRRLGMSVPEALSMRNYHRNPRDI